jgi:hypothetical protein
LGLNYPKENLVVFVVDGVSNNATEGLGLKYNKNILG